MYKTTLDQWLVFKMVFELGGFTAAADALNRSQSTISYSMAKLQKQLGVRLLVMDGKKCELTEIGTKLLHDVYPMLEGFEHLEKKANFLSSGVEANIHLTMESFFPRDVLYEAIAEFAQRYPFTQVNIQEQLRFRPSDEDSSDLAIGVSEDGLLPGPKLLDVKLIFVAHRDHPVFSEHKKALSMAQLAHYKGIHYQRLGKNIERVGEIQSQRWMVNSVESAISAIKAKMCYGCLPEHSVCAFLESGEFKKIALSDETEYQIPLYLVVRKSPTMGEASQYLSTLLIEHSSHYRN